MVIHEILCVKLGFYNFHTLNNKCDFWYYLISEIVYQSSIEYYIANLVYAQVSQKVTMRHSKSQQLFSFKGFPRLFYFLCSLSSYFKMWILPYLCIFLNKKGDAYTSDVATIRNELHVVTNRNLQNEYKFML